ncbi:MAG: peptidoglycan-binding protein [Terriglobales bacterium]
MGTPALGAPFPGRVLAVGQSGPAVLTIQKRLNRLGCGPIAEDSQFGPETQDAVELFQARSADHYGVPLRIDGRVGPLTWAALFAAPIEEVTTAASPLLAQAVLAAKNEIGVTEVPPGSNRGPRVDRYLRAVGLNPTTGHYSWCAAFVYWCFKEAASALKVKNPVIRTAGVLDHWIRAGTAGVHRLSCAECSDTPGLVKPGMIFVISTGSGNGHTGLVEAVRGNYLTTIEGNTNDNGSREGIGVFRRTTRKIPEINRGFVDYAERD